MAVSKMNVALFLVALVMIWSSTSASASRDLNSISMARLIQSGGAAGGGGLVECGNALVELKSCTNEIILFFMNGKADIGTDCCKTIDIITRNCWPAMLTSIGFTTEEGNILRGYCDASSSPPPPPPSSSTTPANAPAAAPQPIPTVN